MEWILIVGGAATLVVVLVLFAWSLSSSQRSLSASQSREKDLNVSLAESQRQTREAQWATSRANSDAAAAAKGWERFWAGGPIAHHLKKVLEILEGYALDDATAPVPFSKRLAEENEWDEAFTAVAIVEYKRFLALYLTTGITVTPSKIVDEVWHLHLQYTENYWGLCRALGVAIHHCPSRGDEVDEAKYQRAFVRTLACYRAVFQADAPTPIWGEIPPAVLALVAEQQSKVDTQIEEEKKKRRRSTVSNPYTASSSTPSDDGSPFIYNFLLWHTVLATPSPAAASTGDSTSTPSVGVPISDNSSASIASCGGGSSGGGSSSYSSDGGSSYGGSSYGGGGYSSCGGSSGGGSSCGGGGGGGASCGGGGM